MKFDLDLDLGELQTQRLVLAYLVSHTDYGWPDANAQISRALEGLLSMTDYIADKSAEEGHRAALIHDRDLSPGNQELKKKLDARPVHELSVPTYYGTAQSAGHYQERMEFDQPNAIVTFVQAEGARMIMPHPDAEDSDVMVERRRHGWMVFVHPHGGDAICLVAILDDGERAFVMNDSDVNPTQFTPYETVVPALLDLPSKEELSDGPPIPKQFHNRPKPRNR